MEWNYKNLQNWIMKGCNVENGLKVVCLICYNKNLDLLPPEIKLLQNLKEIHCFNNNLTVLPPEIGLLKNLEYLNCSENKLKVLPREIGLLQKLEYLNCSENKLKSFATRDRTFEKFTKILL